jgi:alkanesulfonate monooxygenase SsuD/methylene tetrahydromethanopterin reductase-like flavin-dependent oxidoreductase (luciferase family)
MARSSSSSAFHWRNGEPTFLARGGKTQSQITSENVARFAKEHGRNPGTIVGISRKSAEQIEQGRGRNRLSKTGCQ